MTYSLNFTASRIGSIKDEAPDDSVPEKYQLDAQFAADVAEQLAARAPWADPDLDTPCRVSIAGYKLASEGEPGTVGLNIVVAPVLEEHRS